MVAPRFLMVLAATAAALSLPVSAQTPSTSVARDFWIYAWRSPKIDGADARARAMAGAGFTVTQDGKAEGWPIKPGV